MFASYPRRQEWKEDVISGRTILHFSCGGFCSMIYSRISCTLQGVLLQMQVQSIVSLLVFLFLLSSLLRGILRQFLSVIFLTLFSCHVILDEMAMIVSWFLLQILCIRRWDYKRWCHKEWEEFTKGITQWKGNHSMEKESLNGKTAAALTLISLLISFCTSFCNLVSNCSVDHHFLVTPPS